MVLAVTLLAFYSVFAWIAVPAGAWVFYNLGSDFVINDYNVTDLHEIGNPVVGALFDPSFPSSQSWLLAEIIRSQGLIRIVKFRYNGTGYADIVAVHADGLEGAKFTAESSGLGSPLVSMEPYGNGTQVYVFAVAYTTPILAITSSQIPDQPLTLEDYDPFDKFQQWVIYEEPRPGASRPTRIQSLRVASLTDALSKPEANEPVYRG